MSAATVAPPTQDKTTDDLLALVITMQVRVKQATDAVDMPMTVIQRHLLRQHLTVLRGNLCTLQRLLTPPLRPEQIEVGA